MTVREEAAAIRIALPKPLLTDLRQRGRRVPVLLETFDLQASLVVAWSAMLRELPAGGSSFEHPDH
jgi:hypothetical protein